MNEKAYSGDVIEIIKEVVGRAQIGDIHTVDMRQSDMGACDDNVLMTETELVLYDDEYKIIEKNNKIHDKLELENYLDKTNNQLLHDFKWGSQGESDFMKFMRLVRKLY